MFAVIWVKFTVCQAPPLTRYWACVGADVACVESNLAVTVHDSAGFTSSLHDPDADGHEIVGDNGVAHDDVTSVADPHDDHTRESHVLARIHIFWFPGRSDDGVHDAVPPEAVDACSHTVVGEVVDDDDVNRANWVFNVSPSASETVTCNFGRAAPTNRVDPTVTAPVIVGAAGAPGVRLYVTVNTGFDDPSDEWNRFQYGLP